MVLVNDNNMLEVEILQMFGRSCRAMGQTTGIMYLHGNQDSKVDAWTQVRSRAVGKVHDGGKLLHTIV